MSGFLLCLLISGPPLEVPAPFVLSLATEEIEEATDDIPCSQIPVLDMAIDGFSISNFSSSVLGDDGCVVVLGSLTATS